MGGISQPPTSGPAPVALAGRVPVKVSLENGPIGIGDRISASSVAGVGIKATATSTISTVGMALEPFDGWIIQPDGSKTFSQTGKVLVFINLGDPQLAAAKGTGDLSEMTLSTSSGQVTAAGDLNMNGFSLINVKSITGLNNLWKIDENGNIIAQSVETQKLTVGGGAASGVTIYDRTTATPKCIYIEGGVVKTSDGKCGETTNAGTEAVISEGSPTSAGLEVGLPAGTVATTTEVVTEPIIIATSTPEIVLATESVVATTTEPVIIPAVSTSSPQTATSTNQ